MKCSPERRKSKEKFEERGVGFFTRGESPEKMRDMSEMSSRIQVKMEESDSDMSEVKCRRGIIKSEVIESENEFE